MRFASDPCECGRTFLRLDGGSRGRVDDMIIVRGVNVFPSAIEGIVRRFPAVDEFLIEVYRRAEMDEVRLRLEIGHGADHVLGALRHALRVDLGIRVDLVAVPPRTLPRYELKAKRVVRRPGP